MAVFTLQTDEDNARLLRETDTALKASDATVEALTERVVSLETMDTWIRFELHPYLTALATAVPFAPPPELPD